MDTVANAPTMGYDPRKPLNRQIGEIARTTWPSASKRWSIDIRRDGKRTSVQKRFVAPWIRTDTLAFPEEMDATDGIGTKSVVYWRNNPALIRYAAYDAFAMVADDLIERGYRIYKLQDHIMAEADDDAARTSIINLVSSLAEVSRRFDVVVTGGETATLNTIEGFEMGITGTGVKLYHTPSGIGQQSVLIGLASSGVHSNGWTWIRDLYRVQIAGDKKFSEQLLAPTVVYLGVLERLLAEGGPLVHGMVHMTSGGLSKLLELDPTETLDIGVTSPRAINPVFFNMFHDAAAMKKPITPAKMYERFNCGVGFVVAVDPGFKDRAMSILQPYAPVDLHAVITHRVEATPHVAILDQNFDPGKIVTL